MEGRGLKARSIGYIITFVVECSIETFFILVLQCHYLPQKQISFTNVNNDEKNTHINDVEELNRRQIVQLFAETQV